MLDFKNALPIAAVITKQIGASGSLASRFIDHSSISKRVKSIGLKPFPVSTSLITPRRLQ